MQLNDFKYFIYRATQFAWEHQSVTTNQIREASVELGNLADYIDDQEWLAAGGKFEEDCDEEEEE